MFLFFFLEVRFNVTGSKINELSETFKGNAFSFLHTSPLILVRALNVLTCSVEFGFPCVTICDMKR